eukprot:3725694-Rhodomonas_salina.1
MHAVEHDRVLPLVRVTLFGDEAFSQRNTERESTSVCFRITQHSRVCRCALSAALVWQGLLSADACAVLIQHSRSRLSCCVSGTRCACPELLLLLLLNACVSALPSASQSQTPRLYSPSSPSARAASAPSATAPHASLSTAECVAWLLACACTCVPRTSSESMAYAPPPIGADFRPVAGPHTVPCGSPKRAHVA